MSDTQVLYIINQLLVKNGEYFSRCCCDDYFYWEGLPCDALSVRGDSCTDPEECVLDKRIYVTTPVRCAGEETQVCECQKLEFRYYTNAVVSSTNMFTVNATTNWANISGIATSGLFTLIARNTITSTVAISSFNYDNYPTLNHLINSGINATIPFSATANNLDYEASPYMIGSGLKINGTYSDAASIDIRSKNSQIQLITEYGTTNTINFSTSPTTFANNIRARLLSFYPDVTVTPEIDGAVPGGQNFYITFAGFDCGRSVPKLSYLNRLAYVFTWTSGISVADGVYDFEWGSESPYDYSWVPSGNNPCPYENSSYTYSDDDIGYAVFDPSIQCCPQKGATLGPNQNLPGKKTYGTNFEFLERTYKDPSALGSCYVSSPFLFMFGKEGRFDDDPRYPLSTFVDPKCNYTATGMCPNILPENCEIELFTTNFSQDIPWGPFGSYTRGIEDRRHTAYQLSLDNPGRDPDGCNLPGAEQRLGCFYRPSGQLRARGNWQSTKELAIAFRFAKSVPFYTGVDCVACSGVDRDDYWYGRIDTATVSSSSGFTVSGNLGGKRGTTDGMIHVLFDCSGRTVYDFVNGVNNIKTHTDPHGNSCDVFAFCPAASGIDLRMIPASKINNLSSELFQAWKEYAPTGGPFTFDNNVGVSNPVDDSYLFSGSDIFPAPKNFEETWELGGQRPNGVNTDAVACVVTMNLPPPCKRSYALPKVDVTNALSDYQTRVRPFWTSMQGAEYTALKVIKSSAGNFDPSGANLKLAVSGRTLTLNVYSSENNVIYTSGINMDRSGQPYTVSGLITDLNNARFPWAGNPLQTYAPVSAITGNTDFGEIYLDDSTWVSAGAVSAYGVGTRTSISYDYIEPLKELAEKNINSSYAELNAWIRRRCNWRQNPLDDNEALKLTPLYPCASPSADKVKTPSTLQCGADNIIENNILRTYGCLGTVCKTEFYIQATRCACNTMEYCYQSEGFRAVLHPFNRLDLNFENFSQPTMYICATDIHPLCEIPFLIKVPYQYKVNEAYSINYASDCSGYPISGTPPVVEYSQVPWVENWGAMNAGYEGWCQYVDPNNLTLVQIEDIPREYPPVAIVLEKTTQTFCTLFVNPFDLPFTSLSFGKYDAIGPLKPWVPEEYIFPEGTTLNCFAPTDASNRTLPEYYNLEGRFVDIYAYIRPMVKNFTSDEICNVGTVGARIDIDCNTRCCGCGFICEPLTGREVFGPVRAVTLPVVGYQNIQNIDIPVACINYVDPGTVSPGGPCNGFLCSYCDCEPIFNGTGCDNCVLPLCINDTASFISTTNFSAKYGIPALGGVTLDNNGVCVRIEFGTNCCFDLAGQTVESYNTQTGGCNGQWASACLDNGNYCYTGDPTVRTYSTSQGYGVSAPCNSTTTTFATCEGFGVPPFPEGTTQTVTYGDEPQCGSTTENIQILSTNRKITSLDVNLDSCNAGTVSWFGQDTNTIAVTQACGDRNFSNVNTIVGSKSFLPVTYTTCVFDDITTTLSYQEILNFDLHWVCGASNISASGGCAGTKYTY